MTSDIQTDDDHRSALREIERLWGADADADDGIRLESLVDAVEAYESRRWPISAP
jgi:HTH-type transcriptional regulator/antitoxin HigA